MEPITYDSLVHILSFTSEIEQLNIRLVCKDWYETIKSIACIANPSKLIAQCKYLSYIKTINAAPEQLTCLNIVINPYSMLMDFCINEQFIPIKLAFDIFVNKYALGKPEIIDSVNNVIKFKPVSEIYGCAEKCWYTVPTPTRVKILQWFALKGIYSTFLTYHHAAILNNIDLMHAVNPEKYYYLNARASLFRAIHNKNIKIVKYLIKLLKFTLKFDDFSKIFSESKVVGKLIIDEVSIESVYEIYKKEKIRIPEIYNYIRKRIQPILDEEASLNKEWEEFRISFAKIEFKIRKQLVKKDTHCYLIEPDFSTCTVTRDDLKYADAYKSYHEPHFTMICYDKINWSKYNWVRDINSFDKVKVQLTFHNI
ncbi:F-box domain-containing protein [Pacmanvirus A23]|uniref:F-box domain-containing protein n=1 Tax=Pacmanvirus A23 TaxID=1932881 RepID=UPI000A095C02|nr:F-box domain-containing protein [Pacmanvirus A23]SIP86062.1 F-box domain-containing protein [Pacmanvirus A23]